MHNTRRFAIAGLALAALSPAALAQDQTEPAAPTTSNAAHSDIPLDSLYLPRRRALLIGVGQASLRGIDQNPLPQCVIDAKTLAATLGPRGYQCEVIADGEKIEPTAARIRDEIAAASGLAREQDTLLVYISTHGDVLDGKSVVIGKDDAVEIDWIKRHMAASRAAVKILMLDCCRNDKGFERTATEVRDVHCIMACRPDQLSSVGQSGMSVFTEALVDGLVECRADRVPDGRIELDELMYFLERQVPVRAMALDKSKKQNPTRTVVDPKAVTPIFAECTILDRLTFGPAAYENSPPTEARTDLALADLTFLQVQPGMTLDEVTKAIGGTWTNAPELDAQGTGLGILEGKPSEKDALVVRFTDSKVALAQVLYTDLCKEPYDPLHVRAAIHRLVGESGQTNKPAAPTTDNPQPAAPAPTDTATFAPGSLAALTVPLKGLTPTQIIQKLGSPDAALLPTGQFSDQRGELHYPNTPRPGQMLVIAIKGGIFDDVQLASPK